MGIDLAAAAFAASLANPLPPPVIREVIPGNQRYSKFDRATRRPRGDWKAPGKHRNQLCPCGSGRKFKRCCL